MWTLIKSVAQLLEPEMKKNVVESRLLAACVKEREGIRIWNI
jgi:hypothetical protein